MRNLREQSLHRGCMICVPDQRGLVSEEVSVFEMTPAPFQKKELAVGEVVHASSDLQFSVGRVSSIEGNSITIIWESPFLIRADGGSKILIVQLDANPMRIIGSVN